MKITSLLLIASYLVFAAACGKKSETDSVKMSSDQNEQKFDDSAIEKDTEFVVNATDGGVLEVKLGELAQSHGTNSRVKAFGQQMAEEHGKANAELQALAQKKSISTPGTLSDDAKQKYDDLEAKAGSEFDKAYCEFMVKEHKNAIDLFEKEAEKGNDAELKAWANEKLTTLRHHLQMAEEANELVNK